jgi:hypothetical protein
VRKATIIERMLGDGDLSTAIRLPIVHAPWQSSLPTRALPVSDAADLARQFEAI